MRHKNRGVKLWLTLASAHNGSLVMNEWKKKWNLGRRNSMWYRTRGISLSTTIWLLLFHKRWARYLRHELHICTILQGKHIIISYRRELGICITLQSLQGRHTTEVSSVSLPSSREDVPLVPAAVSSASVPSSTVDTPLFPSAVNPESLPSSRVDRPLYWIETPQHQGLQLSRRGESR